MKNKTALVPKLRFPNFEGDWISYSFKEIFNFTTGKNIKQKEAAPHFETPCVRYGELYYMYKEVISNIINYTNLDKSELKFSEGDEILLPSAGEDPMDIGSASALTLKNVAIGRTINILKPKNKNVYSSIFTSYYINQKLRIKISGLAKGVSISNVYNTDLQTLFIKLPSLPEQQKIASFLSAVDQKIGLLEEKKTELSRYKKAMMQKLFSQEIRFNPSEAEALEAYPEWEEKKLREECTFFSGGTPLSTNKTFYNGNIPFIKSGEISHDKTEQLLSELGLTNSSAKLIEKGDLLYALYGATSGQCAISKLNGAINQAVICIRTESLEISYLFQLLGFSKNNIIDKFLQGGQGNLSSAILKNLKFYFPSLPEQQKIASFLSALDEKIEKVGVQIAEAQRFKKSLLQQLFV